jgi:hypothetical protein
MPLSMGNKGAHGAPFTFVELPRRDLAAGMAVSRSCKISLAVSTSPIATNIGSLHHHEASLDVFAHTSGINIFDVLTSVLIPPSHNEEELSPHEM